MTTNPKHPVLEALEVSEKLITHAVQFRLAPVTAIPALNKIEQAIPLAKEMAAKLKDYDELVEAKAATKSSPEETGWCLEKGEACNPRYLTVIGGMLDWTEPGEHLKALRFARREDAELMVEIVDDADRVAEHGWG